jgi:hypothetical protein
MRNVKDLKSVNPISYEMSIYTDRNVVENLKKIFSGITSLERTELFNNLIKKVVLGEDVNDERLKKIVENFKSGSYRYKLKVKTVEDFKKLYQYLKNKYHITITKLLENAKENKLIELDNKSKKEIMEMVSNIENAIKTISTTTTDKINTKKEKRKEKPFAVVLGSTNKKETKTEIKKEKNDFSTTTATQTQKNEDYLKVKDGNYLKLLSIKQQEILKHYINLFEDMVEELCNEYSLTLDPNRNYIDDTKNRKINKLLEDIVKELNIKTKDDFQLHFITTMSIFETLTKYIISKKKENWKEFIRKWYNYYIVSGYIELHNSEIMRRALLEKKLGERETYFKYVLWNFLIKD